MAVGGLLLAVCLLAVMASSVEVPKLKMLDGREMPAIALGTFLGFEKNAFREPQENEMRDVILQAIDLGYRHIDTAQIYGTEAQIGEGIKKKIEEGVIKREDIFVTDKLWNTAHKKEQVLAAIKESLNKTGLDYIDLYLMHWPLGLNDDYSNNDIDYMETWRGLEDVQRLGLAKSIGVSNFNKEQMQRLIAESSIKPVALQIEVHPQFIQTELIDLCKSEGIIVMGYSPFGTLVKRFGLLFPGPKMNDPELLAIGQKYGKNVPQIVLRWAVDRNVVPLPKTVNPKNLADNINIFDFKLTPQEIEKISQFNSDLRITLPSFWQTHPYYPFEKVAYPIADPFKAT